MNRRLYRPVGLKEMELILQNNAFPPRFEWQPIFYPVLNFEYALQIARDWNPQDVNSGYCGFVTAFNIDQQYTDQFEEHTVGAAIHRELWIPSEELATFNQHIQGRIAIEAVFYGENFQGSKHADEMFMILYNAADLAAEITANFIPIQINFPYWTQTVIQGEKSRFLDSLAAIWIQIFPDMSLFKP